MRVNSIENNFSRPRVTLLFQSFSPPRPNVAQDALRCAQQFLKRFAVRMETPTSMSANLKLLRATLLFQSESSGRANVAQDAQRSVQQFLTRFAARMETSTAMSASLKLLRVTLLLESFSPLGRYVHHDSGLASFTQNTAQGSAIWAHLGQDWDFNTSAFDVPFFRG